MTSLLQIQINVYMYMHMHALQHVYSGTDDLFFSHHEAIFLSSLSFFLFPSLLLLFICIRARKA